MSRDPVLTFTKNGIYCPAGDFYIDPTRRVERALITHAHSDHARRGMASYLTTHDTVPVLRHRLGRINVEAVAYGETRQIGGAQVSFHPAGHAPGSAQIRVEVGGEVSVASGDYKVIPDGLSTAFEPVQCHHFITESTFALPVFRWPDQAVAAAEMNAWWAACVAQGKTAFLGAYSFGKAQRLLTMLDPTIGPILTHSTVEGTNEALRKHGFQLPTTVHAHADLNPRAHPGAIVLAPPSTFETPWAQNFGARETGFASGWMALRGLRKKRANGTGFVISDHADWPGLLCAIEDSKAENIYVTHGYTKQLTHYLNSKGWNAQVVPSRFERQDPDTRARI